ncbi:hypothetical protein SteCoe_15450 [Stentor coeruleus]|uniref:Uncharacterized protein n=1 Tax=Stentor coeruleus TaxID=5963 RepID=A0A1R2C3I9_9CILI|nr:hypothetical protein SteCoe_15450 [Stentor coeruleus]
MAKNKDGFDLVSPKSLNKSITSNSKIISGVYREDFQTRLKAYNLTPQPEDIKTDLLNRIKNTYEVEIKYMNEYISRLKKQNTNHYLTPDEAKNDNFLREEVRSLYDKLRNEQKINLQLMEKIDNFNYEKFENSRIKEETPIKKTNIPDINTYNPEILESLKKSYLDKFTECLSYYTKELRKAEEKQDRIDVIAHKTQNELKVMKKLLVVKYKENLNEKAVSTKELEAKILELKAENLELVNQIKSLERDVKFYQEENTKQREIINEMADEVELERSALAIINNITEDDSESIKIHKKTNSLKTNPINYEEKILNPTKKCLKCYNHEQSALIFSEKIENLSLEVSKLNEEIVKLHEDNQNLETINSKMQDLLMFGNYTGNKKEEVYSANEKIYNLEEHIIKLNKNNQILQDELQQKSLELNEAIKKNEKILYRDSANPLTNELQSLKKENNFLKLKSESLKDIKSKFLELVKLLADKDTLEEEIVNVSERMEDDDKGERVNTYTQLRNELLNKSNRVKEMVKCFVSLN